MKRQNEKFAAEPGTNEYYVAYALSRYDQKVRSGIGIELRGLDVLEIGCGHGGVTCYLKANGAKSVTGIDINPVDLQFGQNLAEYLAQELGQEFKKRLYFRLTNAHTIDVEDEAFDLVIADNVFEHFDDPEKILTECYRILRPKGRVHIPIFSSIYSKHGLHLKHGIKMPWANLFFSDKVILTVLKRLADESPILYQCYPGLKNNPQSIRDVRAHRDLNDITYTKFKQIAIRSGFQIKKFRTIPTLMGYALKLIPFLRNSIIADILSYGASATLEKQG